MADALAKEYTGSCCCGRVRFRMTAPLGTFSHCHCTDCRKSHGAGFASYVGVGRARFAWLKGESEIAGHVTESGTRRDFCRACGSSLTCTVRSEPEEIYVAAGTLDTPLDARPEYHIFVRSRLSWVHLADGLPQHREFA